MNSFPKGCLHKYGWMYETDILVKQRQDRNLKMLCYIKQTADRVPEDIQCIYQDIRWNGDV